MGQRTGAATSVATLDGSSCSRSSMDRSEVLLGVLAELASLKASRGGGEGGGGEEGGGGGVWTTGGFCWGCRLSWRGRGLNPNPYALSSKPMKTRRLGPKPQSLYPELKNCGNPKFGPRPLYVCCPPHQPAGRGGTAARGGFVRWCGCPPGATRLVILAQAAGRMTRLVPRVQAAGRMTRLVPRVQAAGRMTRLVPRVQAAGRMTRLVPRVQAAGHLTRLVPRV